MRCPACGYVGVTTTPEAVPFDVMPRFHAYDTMVPSSVDAFASSVHVNAGHLHVNAPTGGLLTGADTVPIRSSRFGEPVPGSVTLFSPALFVNAVATAAGVAFGVVSRKSATAPPA